MRLGVLGPLVLWDGEGGEVPLPGAKVRALLASLVVRRGAPVPVDSLVDDVWGDSPPSDPAGVLQARVSQLRKVLRSANTGSGDAPTVVFRSPGYRLHGALSVDADDFEYKADRASRLLRGADAAAAAELLDDALALWRGRALVEFADEPFARATAARLEERRLAAVEDRAEARSALGEDAALAGELRALLDAHPFRERLRAAHMRALYRSGRQGEALDSYEELRTRLADELGTAPGPEIAALHTAVLRHAPELGPGSRTAGGAGSELGLGLALGSGDGGTSSGEDPRPDGARAGASDVAAAGASDKDRTGPGHQPGRRPAEEDTAAAAAVVGGSAHPSSVHPAGPTPSVPQSGADGPRGRRGRLPVAVGPLIGRDGEAARVCAMVGNGRLTTLTGPGGVGKTRLAVEAASRAGDRFPGGVVLVDLAQVEPGGDPVAAATAALGLRDDAQAADRDPAARFAAALAGERVLIVLDNCEHVIGGAAELAACVIAGAPEAHLLATGREPLGVPGERVRPVAPLGLPAPGAPPDAGALRRTGAVRLFAERAAAARPGWELTDGNAAAVAAVCRRLDGIPLALELAATRIRAMSAAELAERLDDRFRVLSGGRRGVPERQRTLRAVIDWSWETLDADERALLRRLSVFRGGWTLEAAEAVCGAGAALLPSLVDRSLVVAADEGDGGGGTRYRLLETVAAYAAERLAEAGEEKEAGVRHAAYYAEFAERADAGIRGPEQGVWLERLDVECANIKAAVGEAGRSGDAVTALRTAVACAWFGTVRGRLGEVRALLEEALALRPGEESDQPDRLDRPDRPDRLDRRDRLAVLSLQAEAVHAAVMALSAAFDGDEGPIGAALRERLARGRGDARLRRAEWFLTYAEWGMGDLEEGGRRAARVLEAARAAGDRWGTAAALVVEAWCAQIRGDLDRHRSAARESERLFREEGDDWGVLQASDLLAQAAEMRGEYGEAGRRLREGLEDAERLGLWGVVSARLSGLGRIAMLLGDLVGARRSLERARAIAVERGDEGGREFADAGLALVARREGRLDEAEERTRASIARNDRGQGDIGLAFIEAQLGYVAEQRGDAEAALAHQRRGLERARASGDPRAVALALEGTAGALSLAGDAAAAAELLGEADAHRLWTGVPLPEAERFDIRRAEERVRETLGEDAFESSRTRGRTKARPGAGSPRTGGEEAPH
ncbi:AfsR/SARP family transcriptional regulator [Nocardiopsis suaedae]|uniref:BTAD domain-containing putative transcriptional regulator n=1 Tax=Nocardiopsis suaedae TaxID=3018444 RepID=A0ABT4TPI9_9ACTN|nr:BTAD domain-containing putative transcriptional regulator [Nocardiopsis suaedae]MDA2806301.1 BTAD domain-containing putative transcriptional regulator [Nocardiopsis suaedae]